MPQFDVLDGLGYLAYLALDLMEEYLAALFPKDRKGILDIRELFVEGLEGPYDILDLRLFLLEFVEFFW